MLILLFVLAVFWLFSVIGILVLEGFHPRNFALADKVIITYITSTTASVLGLFIIGAKWLFSAQSLLIRGDAQHPQ
jgi:hypothetical protein